MIVLTLSLEFIQVILYAIFSFFVLQYSGMVFCNLLQSMIRTIICSVFLFRFLVLLKHPRIAKITFFIYIIVLLSFDLYESIDIFIEAHRISCVPGSKDHWQIYTLISVDTMQSIILIVTSVITYRNKEMRSSLKGVLSDNAS